VAEVGDRKVGAVFGLLGAVVLALAGFLDLASGVFDVVVGRSGHAYFPFDQGLIFVVVALIVGVFAVLGGLRGEGRSTVAGAVLVVVALAGWLVLGLASGLLPILGNLLVLVGGVVFLVSGR
jgi:hypothetical protein